MTLSDYTNPPVVEVVCGVNFVPLTNFKSVHLGLFWERIKEEFPTFVEQPPITAVVESLNGPRAPTAEIQFTDTPPLPRLWFIDKSGDRIIQVQNDLFLHNWRKLNPSDEYPRYVSVFKGFSDHFARLTSFIEEQSLGSILPIQYELTYINQILESQYWTENKILNGLFPDFAWRNSSARFLPDYEGVNWRTSFRLPGNKGRLHISIQTAHRAQDNKPLVILEMRARGIGSDSSINAMRDWFDTAHEWIVSGFSDIADKQAQLDLWGLKV